MFLYQNVAEFFTIFYQSIPGKNFRGSFQIFFPISKIWNFMQIVNVHEIWNPIFWENKKNIINLLSAEFSNIMIRD